MFLTNQITVAGRKIDTNYDSFDENIRDVYKRLYAQFLERIYIDINVSNAVDTDTHLQENVLKPFHDYMERNIHTVILHATIKGSIPVVTYYITNLLNDEYSYVILGSIVTEEKSNICTTHLYYIQRARYELFEEKWYPEIEKVEKLLQTYGDDGFMYQILDERISYFYMSSRKEMTRLSGITSCNCPISVKTYVQPFTCFHMDDDGKRTEISVTLNMIYAYLLKESIDFEVCDEEDLFTRQKYGFPEDCVSQNESLVEFYFNSPNYEIEFASSEEWFNSYSKSFYNSFQVFI